MEPRQTPWLLAALAAGCTGPGANPPPQPTPAEPFVDDAGVAPGVAVVDPTATAADASAGDLTSPLTPSGPAGDANSWPDVSAAIASVPDAGPEGGCGRPPASGDLLIDELMIESIAGTGDYGEWFEIASNATCLLNLRGLHGECPRGAKVATFDVADDLWVPANGTFVVADSSDPAINHYLPGPLLNWFGHPGDVLRNKGTTITLTLNGNVIDSVTYPALSLVVGTSFAFPADCDPTVRSDWTRWKLSTASWFPGFFGTPNSPNLDVSCSP